MTKFKRKETESVYEADNNIQMKVHFDTAIDDISVLYNLKVVVIYTSKSGRRQAKTKTVTRMLKKDYSDLRYGDATEKEVLKFGATNPYKQFNVCVTINPLKTEIIETYAMRG